MNAFWEINPRLVLDVSAAKTDGHFRGLPDGQNSIPDAHEEVLGAGLTYVGLANGWTASMRVRHFGDATLTEDESVFKRTSTLVNLGISYEQPGWEFGVDVLNLFDREDDDIAYFFESRLPGELQGVEDVHFHPTNSRAVRALLRYRF